MLVNSRRHGQRIRSALVEHDVPAESFFREEALDTEAAKEAITLLTLRLNPNDRVALRAWLGFDAADARVNGYRRLWTAADENNTDVAAILPRIATGKLKVPYSQWIVARWTELQDRLKELEPLGEDLAALVDALFPETSEELAFVRAAALLALQAWDETDPIALFPNAVRYQIGQPDVPFDAKFVRVMSLHRSKGLTARLVVIAGLVSGLVPKGAPKTATMDERTAHDAEQRRLLYVGLTRCAGTLVLSGFQAIVYDEAMRYGVVGQTRRVGGELTVITLASPLLAELGATLPNAAVGRTWVREMLA